MIPIGTYTFYSNFENCPFKAWHLYVLKDIPFVRTPEMDWGNEVHTALEKRVRDRVPLPEKMQQCEGLAGTIAQLPDKAVEEQLAIDAHGRPCDYYDKTGKAWFRGKLDFRALTPVAAWILDWKTGKLREEPFELECQALMLKAHHPELETIVANYFWLQTGQSGIRYTLTDWGKTFGKLQQLRAEMETYDQNGHWPKRKNPLCGWCAVVSCEHNTSAKRKK